MSVECVKRQSGNLANMRSGQPNCILSATPFVSNLSPRSPTVTNGYHVLANTLSLIQHSTRSHRGRLRG